MKWLQTYTGFWRNLRLLHFIYNYINRQKLKRNKDLYKRFGIKKSVYSSISSKDFIGKPNRLPWLDYPVTQEKLMEHPVFMQFDKSIQTALLGWHRNGFLVLASHPGRCPNPAKRSSINGPYSISGAANGPISSPKRSALRPTRSSPT